MRIARGDIWLADYGKPVGREQGLPRPCIVLSGAAINNKPIGLLMSIPITSKKRGWPSHVEVGLGATGLLKPSWAMAEQFRTISVQRLKRRLGYVDDAFLDRINVIIWHLLQP